MSEAAKRLSTRRGTVKSKLTRFESYVNEMEEPLNQQSRVELKLRMDTTFKLLAEYELIQAEIEQLDVENALVEQYKRERSDFEKRYFKALSQAETILNTSQTENSSGSSSSTTGSVSAPVINGQPNIGSALNIKLPQMNLPIFSGEYDRWTQFKQTFEGIINAHAGLTNIQRFYYLQSCLKGDASKVISSLSITETNYNVAWDLLKTRFDNKRAIVNSHLAAILSLTPVTKESHAALRSFQDNFLQHFRSLNTLGEQVRHWDTILIFILLSKLDFKTRREWETYAKDIDAATIDDMTNFLSERAHLLESWQHNRLTTAEPASNFSNDKFKQRHGRASVNHAALANVVCPLCKQSHFIYGCKRFLELSINSRLAEARRLNLCMNCLKRGHNPANCFSESSCRTCHKRHNSLLHKNFDNVSPGHGNQNQTYSASQHTNRETGLDEQPSTSNNHSSQLRCNQVMLGSFVILPTAIIQVLDAMNKPITCRALLDSGSQSNFITKSLFAQLKVQSDKVNIPIVGINNGFTDIKAQVNINIRSLQSDYKSSITCLVISKITTISSQHFYKTSEFMIPSAIHLADPGFNHPSEVDILLGAGAFFELLQPNQIKLGVGKPILQETKVGWVVSGNIRPPPTVRQHCNLSTTSTDLLDKLEQFWTIEETDNAKRPKYTLEETDCENNFIETVSRDATGRFVVRLPTRDNINKLGESCQTAIKRFHSLERKFSKSLDLTNEYIKFMEEYENLGHMTEINPTSECSNFIYYMPHHAVEKVSSITTKTRVVFDASSKSSSSLSLNDVLKVGPTIQNDLFSTLLRFRKHNVVCTADIAKMYRQVNVYESHRDLQRIVWRSNPDAELKHYKLNTITYGTGPASFLATRVLKQLAVDNDAQYPQESQIIANDFYVDDLLTGSKNVHGLIKIRKNITRILASAGFELRKFAASDPRVLADLRVNCKPTDQFIVSDGDCNKTLGIIWNSRSDCFIYRAGLIGRSFNRFTKRHILSETAQIFDPLGLLGPIVVLAKLILQQLWQLQVGWDDSVPCQLHNSWSKFRSELNQIQSISIPRHALRPGCTAVQLHGFCDASEKAYGCCVYIRSLNEEEKPCSRLLCAKSRVAPLKSISLPRLELCGAVLLARLMLKVTSTLNIDFESTYYWTDSTIVLSWLSSQPTTWKAFVSNRVSEIQQITNSNNWYHISGRNNPADIISRGSSLADLQSSSLWWKGPNLLTNESLSCDSAHISKFARIARAEIPEFRAKSQQVLTVGSGLNFIERISSYSKLVRVTAYCKRFINNIRKDSLKKSGDLAIGEIEEADIFLIKWVQAQSFANELHQLIKHSSVKVTSKLKSLNPFLDDKNIIRVGGRLSKSCLDFNQKHQILLPYNHHFSKIIILHTHKVNLHAGVLTSLSIIRQRFWPINGKRMVRDILSKCTKCFKARPTSLYPLMGDLPSYRVTPSPPFASVGVDYAGPFEIKDGKCRNRKLIKSYVCIFTCFSTKAIHIELVSELTTTCFLAALRRFVSRRGLCSNIFSDNATYFCGANNELKEISRLVETDAFKTYLLENKIEWHFIPARSPHFGGLWEHSVKLVKRHLKRVANCQTFTYEEFYTLLVQTEAILNSRPITPLSSDPNDLQALTPGHFLIGRPMISVPDFEFQTGPINNNARFKHIQRLIKEIWKRWNLEYLHNMQQRSKWRFAVQIPKLDGALVLLREENTPVLNWPMGRIIATHPGEDGITRAVSVKTKNGIVKRAVTRVCLLPMEEEDVKKPQNCDQGR